MRVELTFISYLMNSYTERQVTMLIKGRNKLRTETNVLDFRVKR